MPVVQILGYTLCIISSIRNSNCPNQPLPHWWVQPLVTLLTYNALLAPDYRNCRVPHSLMATTTPNQPINKPPHCLQGGNTSVNRQRLVTQDSQPRSKQMEHPAPPATLHLLAVNRKAPTVHLQLLQGR